ncbi:hypothetical protein HU200_058444 [Digitaria exilis]|uniref:Uncharacterized protein n=1 Tax=Digitaria exilis TaxID=1010633 RepID=A0A835AHX1_9POAL|nr:hypothetical protein HU200_058444 [Digitaria exilis]
MYVDSWRNHGLITDAMKRLLEVTSVHDCIEHASPAGSSIAGRHRPLQQHLHGHVQPDVAIAVDGGEEPEAQGDPMTRAPQGTPPCITTALRCNGRAVHTNVTGINYIWTTCRNTAHGASPRPRCHISSCPTTYQHILHEKPAHSARGLAATIIRVAQTSGRPSGDSVGGRIDEVAAAVADSKGRGDAGAY